MLETAGLVVAPVTLLTALLYYFGWARSNALWLYFGIDPSTIGFSTQDYLLRALGAVYVPLAAILIIGVLLLDCHLEVVRWIMSGRHMRVLKLLARVLALVGLALFAAGIAGELRNWRLVTPLAFALGAGALTYAANIRRMLRAPSTADITAPGSLRIAKLKTALIAAFITLAMFWALGDWAGAAGLGRAEDLAQHLADQPGVVIYSKERLQLRAPGVYQKEYPDADSAYRFSYSGLKLLIHSGGKYFLVPSDWTRSNGVAIVLPDSNDRRVEFIPPSQ